VFLIPTSYLLLGQKPQPIKLLGVVLIVIGSLAHAPNTLRGRMECAHQSGHQRKRQPLHAARRLIFSFTNPLDKKLVDLSDVYVEAASYGLGLVLSFYILARSQKAGFAAAARGNVKWIALAGIFDAVSLLFQLASYAYLSVVITVSIKRAGIVLSVFAGWLFFKERGITDKVIASSVMFAGVLILYLPLDLTQALAFMAATLAGMTLALYRTRMKPA
jgi:drug/metabolite transporter (DMT)-like permease